MSANNSRVIVTEEFLIQGRHGPGGWNSRQLAILGLKWPPKKGWMKDVEGMTISKRSAERFLQLKGNTAKKKLKRKFRQTTQKTLSVELLVECITDKLQGDCPHSVLRMPKRFCKKCLREAIRSSLEV